MKLKDKVLNLINSKGDEEKSSKENHEATENQEQPVKRSKSQQIKDAAVGTVVAAKNRISHEKEAVIRRTKFLFFIWNLLSILFYTLSAVFSIIKSWSDSPLSYIVLAVTLIYVVVFMYLILSKRKDKDEMFNEVSSYKSGFKLWKLILNIINTVLALLVMINALGSDFSGFEKYLITILSVAWLTFKVLLSIFNLLKFFAKKRKAEVKARKKELKNQSRKSKVLGDEGSHEE